jgi:hypothetical protein
LKPNLALSVKLPRLDAGDVRPKPIELASSRALVRRPPPLAAGSAAAVGYDAVGYSEGVCCFAAMFIRTAA